MLVLQDVYKMTKCTERADNRFWWIFHTWYAFQSSLQYSLTQHRSLYVFWYRLWLAISMRMVRSNGSAMAVWSVTDLYWVRLHAEKRNSELILLIRKLNLIKNCLRVRVLHSGGADWVVFGDPKQQKDVSKILNRYSHPDYKPSEFDNDIALYEVKDAVKFSSTLRPICLSTTNIVDRSDVVVATTWYYPG